MTMNTTWGFKFYDDQWKSPETIIRNLIDIASKGGNYLLNVGPTKEGLIPQPSVERLARRRQVDESKRRIDLRNDREPLRRLSLPSVERRAKPGRVYLHVFDWPADGKLRVPAWGANS